MYTLDMNTYKFKISPNKEQEERINTMFGCSRFVWNYFLDLNNKIYLEAKEKDLKKKHLNYYDCANKLTGLKKEQEYSCTSSKRIKFKRLLERQFKACGAVINR